MDKNEVNMYKFGFEYDEVFVDIFNALLFKDDVINTESLGCRVWSERDSVCKQLNNSLALRIICCGDNTKMSDEELFSLYRMPSITLVLNFSRKKWNRPTSLFEIVKIDDEIKKYAYDYKLNVVNVCYLLDEDLNRMKSEMKNVFKFIRDVNNRIINYDDFLKLDIREVLERIALSTHAFGHAVAFAIGYVEGIEIGKRESIKTFLSHGMEHEKIMQCTGYTLKEIEKVQQENLEE